MLQSMSSRPSWIEANKKSLAFIEMLKASIRLAMTLEASFSKFSISLMVCVAFVPCHLINDTGYCLVSVYPVGKVVSQTV